MRRVVVPLYGAPFPMSARRKLLAGLVGAAVLAGSVRVRAQSPMAADAESDQPLIENLDIGRSQLEVQFAPGFDERLRAEARLWVRRSGDAVAAYFGAFPVAEAELLITPLDGSGVRSGVTYGVPSPLIRIRLGKATTRAHFMDDWVLVHEMVHLAVPSVPQSQNWLHEGVATYVESVARGRAGLVPPATVWRRWAKAMTQGQPRAGDRGLDRTPTWGRTYWGGAMFCLLADVQMLKRSDLRVGLQQALQGVLKAGGNYSVQWPVRRILDTADSAVGQSTLAELYGRMKDAPAPVDLDGLWRELGVYGDRLDEAAPMAAVRRTILS